MNNTSLMLLKNMVEKRKLKEKMGTSSELSSCIALN